MTEMVTYTHSVGNSIEFRTKDVTIDWVCPGKSVETKHKTTGTASKMNDSVVVDPNKGYRVITVTMKDLQGYHATQDCIDNLNTYILPATKPTYDATYPNIRLMLDGTNYWDILCVMMGPKAHHIRDNKWSVTVTFMERTS